MKNLAFISFFLFTIHLSAQQQKPNPKVDQIFAKWDKPDSPGCALAVVKEGKIIYKRGYGLADLEHQLPNQSNTVFYIGSVSKQFVTMCILLLEEKGMINLNDNVRKYFPELPDYGPSITIRNLIHHTSGIRDYLTLWQLAGNSYLDDMDEQEVYKLICRQKELNFRPGTKYLYSNSCYFMMAMLVQKVTGKPISQFAKEEIFDPLGMDHSMFYDDNRKLIPNRAFGYSPNPGGGFYNMMMRFDLVGSGGVYSTVEDLYKWDQNFYQNRLGRGGQRIIKQMHTNGRLKNGTEIDYAFALVNGRYRGLKTVSHGGALGGYRAHYLRFPEQSFSVIILSNLSNFNPSARTFEVADIYLADTFTESMPSKDDIAGGPSSKPNKQFRPISPDTIKTMVGRYYSEEIDATYEFIAEEDHLFVEVQHDLKNELKKIGNREFTGGTFTIRMNKDFNGFELDAGRVKNLKFVRQ